jgi:energy-coupling factor transporter ATP-binding protein EcfA2
MTRIRVRFADVVIDSAIPLPELVGAGEDDYTRDVISIEEGVPEPPFDWYHVWPNADNEPWARFGDTAHGYLVQFPDCAAFGVSRDGRTITMRRVNDGPIDHVRHRLLHQVVPLALSLTGRLVLHAGSVTCDGRAVLVVGPSGSGKSTLVAACARAGAAVMADDSVVVTRHADRWMAHPSYPAVRLWPSSLRHAGLNRDHGEGSLARSGDKHLLQTSGTGWTFQREAAPVSLIVLLASPSEASPPRPASVDVLSQVFRMDLRDAPQSGQVFMQVTQMLSEIRVVRVVDPAPERQVEALVQMVTDMA